jgi:hypothetical protein
MLQVVIAKTLHQASRQPSQVIVLGPANVDELRSDVAEQYEQSMSGYVYTNYLGARPRFLTMGTFGKIR